MPRSQGSRQPSAPGRPALIILRDGRRYVADVYISQGFVHGQRVHEKLGCYEAVSYCARADRAWSRSVVREVRWQAPDRIAAA